MNDGQARNEFKEAIEALLAGMELAASPQGVDAYASAGQQTVLEHNTRRFFLDGLLIALGWTLGTGGNVAEEAQVKADTTTFLDYLGVKDGTRTPVIIVEAKRWDIPFISRSSSGQRGLGDAELILASVEHTRSAGPPENSPVTKLWQEFIDQIYGYVCTLDSEYGHEVQRVILTSGQWLIVFTSPSATFLGRGATAADAVVIFRKSEYVERSSEILGLLGQAQLIGRMPATLRPTQLASYIQTEAITAVFHALHVKYEETGSSRFMRRPRILVYPALIFQRKDGVLLTVMDRDQAFILDYDKADEDVDSLEGHLSEVAAAAATLLASCGVEVGRILHPAPLGRFPGFPLPEPRRDGFNTGATRLVADEAKTPNEWMMATGEATHYLRNLPRVETCRFHEWRACSDVGQGISNQAIARSSTREPRAFFVDGKPHHCAHQSVQDQRIAICHIMPLDQRTCCQACIYLDVCWPTERIARLPCGK